MYLWNSKSASKGGGTIGPSVTRLPIIGTSTQNAMPQTAGNTNRAADQALNETGNETGLWSQLAQLVIRIAIIYWAMNWYQSYSKKNSVPSVQDGPSMALKGPKISTCAWPFNTPMVNLISFLSVFHL